MAVAKHQRPKASIVSQVAIEQASALLQDLPDKPKEQLSLREAIRQMQPQIQAALAKGYSYEEVARSLNEKGISISVSTLKSYLASGKRQTGKQQPVDPSDPTPSRRKRTTQKPKQAIEPEIEPEAVVESLPEPEAMTPLDQASSPDQPPSAKPVTRSTRKRQKAEA